MLTFHVNIPRCFSDGETGTQINDTVLLVPYHKLFISFSFCILLPWKAEPGFVNSSHERSAPALPCPAQRAPGAPAM